ASCLFFFSSRRRHTRFSRDWSSDVCSSDLSYGNQFIQGSIIYVSFYVGHTELAKHQLVVRHLLAVCLVLLLGEFEIEHNGFLAPHQHLIRAQCPSVWQNHAALVPMLVVAPIPCLQL